MRKAFTELHIAIFLAGITGLLGRLITLNEGLLVAYRMVMAALVLWLVDLLSGRTLLPGKKGFWQMMGAGSLIALHWVFFYGSIKYANVSIGLVCFSAVSFFTAFLDPLITRRRLDRMEVALGLAVMLGIYLIFHFEARYATGILLGIISSFLCTLFVILSKDILLRNDAYTVTRLEMTGGAITLLVLMPAYLHYFPSPSLLPSSNDLFWLGVLSILCTVVAFSLSNRALQKISPFTVNISYNLEPVYGILLAFAVYREDRYLGPSFYAGLCIIAATVLIQSWRVWHKGRAFTR
jgi:drug/metabolite transporter (DMT)-like permease